LDAVHGQQIPEPSGSHESVLEYDRRHIIKEQVLASVVGACVDMSEAIRTMRAALSAFTEEPEDTPWQAFAAQLEKAVQKEDAPAARAGLPAFLADFQKGPLLFVALASGIDVRQGLRARMAHALLLQLVDQLPRLGLLRETYHLLLTARAMEQNSVPAG